MKKLITILFLILTMSGFAQLDTAVVQVGQYAIRTFHTTNTTRVNTWDEITYIAYDDSTTTVTVADDTIQVPLTATASDIETLISGAAANTALLFPYGFEISESVSITKDDIIFDRAAGTGTPPEFNADSTLTGLTQYSDSIYMVSTTSTFNQLYVNGVKQSLAKNVDVSVNERNTITSVTNSTTFISTELIGTDWTGSYCQMSSAVWSMQPRLVTACNSTTGEITLESAPYYNMYADNKFFMVNSLSNVTEVGKWCLDEANNILYYWSTNGQAPTNIKAATVETGIVINDVDNITIRNINFRGHRVSISVNDGNSYSADNITIDNCEFENGYKAAINLNYTYNTSYKATNSTISNNTITGASSRGIVARIDGCLISRNTITGSGDLENIGLDGYIYFSHGGVGMYLRTDASTVTNNYIEDSGYNGIDFIKNANGYNNIIDDNIVKTACQHLADGGGIYVQGIVTGTTINGNIIQDIGYTGIQECHGIYCDATTDGVNIENNVVSGCNKSTSFGLFASNTTNLTVRGNTFFNNSTAIRFKHWYTSTRIDVANDTIENNILYAITPTQECGRYSLMHEFTTDTLYLSGNKYYSAQNALVINYNSTYYTLSQFQSFSSQESGAATLSGYIENYENVVAGTQLVDETFNSSISGWGTSIGSWNNTQLDNGCINITIPVSDQGYFNRTLGSIGSNYLRIELDAIAPGENLTANINIDGKLINNFIIDNTRRHYTFYKDVSEITGTFMSCFIQGAENDNSYFDNIKVNQATADYISPTGGQKLFVNKTDQTTYVDLSDYTDPEGNDYTSNEAITARGWKIAVNK